MDVYVFYFLRSLSAIFVCVITVIWRKWTAVAVMLIIQFYLVEVNTHTDFGALMQQLDQRMDGVIFKQEVTSLHDRKCKSHGVALRLTVP